MKKLLKWLAIIVGSVFAIVVIVGVMDARENAKSYEANTVAADQRFKGVRFKVTGRVVSISTDFMGAPYVLLEGGINQFMQPQFSFSKADAGMVAGLVKGDMVTFDVAKTPMSGECKRL